MKNLGSTKIEARPGPDSTDYVIEVEKPVLREGLIAKVSIESGLVEKEQKLLGAVGMVHGLSPSKIIVHLPCTDARACTEFISLFLKWLDSTYFEQLGRIKDFEEPILRENG